ncbi:MAG: hypothetical protein Hens3KO_22060 [Henriciella sp.]
MDLRSVPMDQRRALCAEAERRARAGEDPVDIRAALGVSYTTYSRWARQFGFRQADLFPETPRAGAPVSAPPGPGGWVRSGRFYRGLGLPEDHPVSTPGPGHPGWTGGAAVSRQRYSNLRDERRDALAEEVSALSPAALLAKVEAALESGAAAQADRLLRAWRAEMRREAGLDALRQAAGVPVAVPAKTGFQPTRLPESWTPDQGLCGLSLKEMDPEQREALLAHYLAGLDERGA